MALKSIGPNGLVKTLADNFNTLAGGIAGEVFYVEGVSNGI